jgi:hypothetical protein
MIVDPERSTHLSLDDLSSSAENLTYLYGIVLSDAVDPPDELRGLDGSPVRLLRRGNVAAIVSSVAADVYSDEALDAMLPDLEWVGDRGMAHERVLDWYAERGPVIPLSLFSLHRDDERAAARVGAGGAEYERVLGRLVGRTEWGIKLWRREAIAREGIDRLSVSLQELGRQIDESPPGKRFLLERKRETMRLEELRALSKRIALESFADLRGSSEAGVSVPIPSGAAGAERTLLLHAAFLVRDGAFDEFQQAVNSLANRLTGSGFELEFTGPWPAYHFSTPGDD